MKLEYRFLYFIKNAPIAAEIILAMVALIVHPLLAIAIVVIGTACIIPWRMFVQRCIDRCMESDKFNGRM